METLGTICVLIVLAQPFIFIAGMIKPQWVLPKKLPIKRKRLTVFLASTFMLILFAAIMPEYPQEKIDKRASLADSLSKDTVMPEEKAEPKIVEISIDSVDVLLSKSYKNSFDSLYNGLMELDKIDDGSRDRQWFHEKIQKLLFEDWWNTMEALDSTRQKTPLLRKEYERLQLKYDKQYARFMLYGNEDRDRVRRSAEYEAERILQKVLVDPESLVIEQVLINGKTNKGYKCTVVYRARNGFGGYVREYATLIMAYNKGSVWDYECVYAE